MAKKSVIPSPCIAVCTVEEDTGFCRGCYRSLQEIAHWDYMEDPEKSEVLAELEERKKSYGGPGHC